MNNGETLKDPLLRSSESEPVPKKFSGNWGTSHGTVTVIINILVLVILSLSMYVNTEDSRLFSYGWTYRLGSKDERVNMTLAKESIMKMYKSNLNSANDHLGTMLDDIYSLAMCKPALYDGGLEWSADEMSPMCNCLRNMHVEYVRSIHPAGVPLNVQQMNSTDTRTKTEVVIKAINIKCFSAVRHTQVRQA